jgi:hypothetical protein
VLIVFKMNNYNWVLKNLKFLTSLLGAIYLLEKELKFLKNDDFS